MLLLTTLCLVLLACVNYRFCRRQLFHPAVVFCSSWAAGLLIVWASGDIFFGFLPETLAIFLAGAVAFSVGSALIFFIPERGPKKPGSLYPPSNWVVNALVLLVVVSTPFAVRWILNAASQHPGSNFFVQASITMLDERLADDPGHSAFSNVVTLASIVAVIAFVERKGHQKRWLLSALLALGLNVLTAGRSVLVFAIFSIVCIDWFQTRRVRWKFLVTVGLAFIIMVCSIAIYLGKVGASTEASLGENVAPLARGLALYAAGSLVAFDRVMREPTITPHNWRMTRFFEERLHRIDPSFKPSSETVEFVSVGPHQFTTNTYTMFFTLIDYGGAGTMLVFAVLGFVTSLCYRRALNGGPIAILIYSCLFSAIPLGLFGDFYFHNLNYLLKLFCIAWGVYSLPRWWSKSKAMAASRVEHFLRLGTRKELFEKGIDSHHA